MVLWDRESEPSAAWLSILTGSVFSSWILEFALHVKVDVRRKKKAQRPPSTEQDCPCFLNVFEPFAQILFQSISHDCAKVPAVDLGLPRSRPAHSSELLSPFDPWLSLLCCCHPSGSAALCGSVVLTTEILHGAFACSCLQRDSLSLPSTLCLFIPCLLCFRLQVCPGVSGAAFTLSLT